MGPKTKSGIHWTNLELKGLLEDEDSCVYLERAKKHLGLHPVHLNDLNGSLREILSEKLNFFDPELNGLVLAYRNPRILSPYGEILYDTCYIHIDIEADFYVFRPEIGRSLKGYVNKKSTNHIGILVHKAYNVSIPRPDGDELSDDNWPGHHVRVGQEIRFTPEEIDFKSRLPYIRGLLHEDEYLNGCQLFNEQIAASYELEFQENTRRSFNQDSPNKSIVKTENKHIIFNSDDDDSEVEVNPDSGSERKSSIKKVSLNGTLDCTDSPSKKKKRKSTPARELGSDEEAKTSDQEDATQRPKKCKHNMSPSETEDERAQKSKIKKLSETDALGNISDTESTTGSHKKKHKKKSKNYLDFDTEDERNHKAEIRNITNNLSQGSTDSDESVSYKKSKKQKVKAVNGETSTENPADESTSVIDDAFVTKRPKKKKTRDTECVDTEDELQYKSTIDKSLTPMEVDEPEKTKSKKKRKRSILEEVPEDTEDERNYKSSLKEYIEANNLVPEEPPRKRKKKHSYCEIGEDTEDERRNDNSLDDSGFRVPETPRKKHKKRAVQDDTLMDTEDERQHKSYLKGLVEAMESNGSTEISEERVEYKKEKKSRKNSISCSQNLNGIVDETNALFDAVVKDEEEQEAKKKSKKKDKHRREESVSREIH